MPDPIMRDPIMRDLIPSAAVDAPAGHHAPLVLGWREWLILPQLGIGPLRAKLDTGARSSALHVDTLEEFERDGAHWLRFSVGIGRHLHRLRQCEAPSIDRRAVIDTGGRRSQRWFIHTTVELAGRRFAMEVNLTDRRHMLFPLLVGRSALHGRFIIDPALSHTQPRPAPVASAAMPSPP